MPLEIGYPLYHLTWRKPTLIQKPSTQINEAFHQHVIAGKPKLKNEMGDMDYITQKNFH